jgi:parallel beta-helix repeat protein
MTKPLERRKGNAIATIVFVAFPVLALWGGAGPALATHVGCADVIVEDTTLDSDITNCGHPGLTIAADNITLDLGGHTIDGLEYPPMIYTTGIDNRAGHDGVKIRNGRIQGYDDGVYLDGADRNQLTSLSGSPVRVHRGHDNLFTGLRVSMIELDRVNSSRLSAIGSSGSRTILGLYRSNDNRVEYSALKQLDIGYSDRTEVVGNSVSEGERGIVLSGASDTRVERNTVFGNAKGGISAYTYSGDSGHNRIEHNFVHGNGGPGIGVWSALQDVVRDNKVNSNDEGIVVSCQDCEVARNRLSRNRVAISVYGDRNRVLNNLLTGNSRGVFLQLSRDALVARNVIAHGAPNTERSGISITNESRRNQILSNVLSDLTYGISLGSTEDNTIEHNRVDVTGLAIALNSGPGNAVRWNSIHGGDTGLYVIGGHHGEIVGNSVVGGLQGMYLGFSDDNLIRRNRFVRNEWFGLRVIEEADRNLIERNTITRAGGDGIAVAPRPESRFEPSRGNVLRANRITRSEGDGIFLDAFGAGTILDRNWTLRNLDDGIDVEDPTATLTGNLAYANRDRGIEAVAGVIDGGGNEAWRNGNRAQCLNVAC